MMMLVYTSFQLPPLQINVSFRKIPIDKHRSPQKDVVANHANYAKTTLFGEAKVEMGEKR